MRRPALDAILCHQETRRVSNTYTLRFGRTSWGRLNAITFGLNLRNGQDTFEQRVDGNCRCASETVI